MLTRYDEQVWYKVLCGHNAPPQGGSGKDWAAERDARHRRLISLADEKDAGTTTKEISERMNWSIGYTQQRIRYGRRLRNLLAWKALAVLALVYTTPAFAGGGIGQLAPLGGLAYQPYQPYYGRQEPPRMETVIPDGLGGYHVFAPNRPMTTVVPDGFGGYTIYNGR